MKDWIEGKLEDLIEINPKVKLEKGKVYPFVSMGVIDPFYKPVESIEEREFKSGGSKFCNGDTLFARITPCLENGKIAKVKKLNDGKGFGSTEFFILRGKEGITDNEFVYYLSTSKFFRKNAEKFMTGTSGRQRVDKQQFSQQTVRIPPIHLQRKIASILGTLDDKIELNNKMNQTLEEMAMTIYKHWFVDFGPFQDGEFVESELGMIPKGWEISRLEDVAEVKGGKRLPKGKTVKEEPTPYRYIRVKDFTPNGIDIKSVQYIDEEAHLKTKGYLITSDDIYISIAGTIGLTGFVPKVLTGSNLTENAAKITNFSDRVSKEFLLCFLRSKRGKDQIYANTVGSTQPKLPLYGIKGLKFALPPIEIMKEFSKRMEIFNLYEENILCNMDLTDTRDFLLPKLLSGEIDLLEVEETV